MKRVVVLTGAGISAESGIQTFRDQNGLWASHAIEDVATPEGFARNPALVQAFYNARRAQLQDPEIQPNAAHLALAEFEAQLLALGGDFLLITQNVDNLHQRAGTQNLLPMHGELQRAKCVHSGQSIPWFTDITEQDSCLCCQPPQPLRPDIVWFGEMPYAMQECYDALMDADVFISIGTSGQVYPAAGFMQIAQEQGALTVELNLEATSHQFDQGVYGPATDVVPAYLDEFLKELKY
ncbi:Sir2 family NAD+-dependent deacetylase [Nitrincola tapanii]|nr:Sir2 family NAD+-dependent deacetylase [Nitrincola tapanii]